MTGPAQSGKENLTGFPHSGYHMDIGAGPMTAPVMRKPEFSEVKMMSEEFRMIWEKEENIAQIKGWDFSHIHRAYHRMGVSRILG